MSDEKKNEVLGDSEKPVGSKESSTNSQRKMARDSARGKQQWITDIILIFLLLSGAFLLYEFNKQSERMELMKHKQGAGTAVPTGKKGY